jgi:hypothetical protein
VNAGFGLQIGLVTVGIALCCVIVLLPDAALKDWASNRGVTQAMARLALLVYVIVTVVAAVWALRNWDGIVAFIRFTAELAHQA